MNAMKVLHVDKQLLPFYSPADTLSAIKQQNCLELKISSHKNSEKQTDLTVYSSKHIQHV